MAWDMGSLSSGDSVILGHSQALSESQCPKLQVVRRGAMWFKARPPCLVLGTRRSVLEICCFYISRIHSYPVEQQPLTFPLGNRPFPSSAHVFGDM